MLFNSYEFIFAFMPVVTVAYFIIGRTNSRRLTLGWLAAASAIFYGLWNPINVAIIFPSIIFNFFMAKTISRLDENRAGLRSLVLVVGIVANIGFLGYFKYKNFFSELTNSLFATHFPIAPLLLPLGISFITFQKIAFLVDVHSGLVKKFSLFDFMVFVLFFPQLVAGPIVHFRELMPQFAKAPLRPNPTDVLAAIALFSIGLFKKVVIADGIAEFVTPAFGAAASGQAVSLLPAWGGALAYTFQIYFDFSGYSDMALGLARIFGVRLPMNFNSPLRASSIIEFWGRWHITLTRFLTAYIYTPIVLSWTRRRLMRRKPVLAGSRTKVPAFAVLVAVPTILTMAVSGLWHGAGLQFILWGLIHGLLLIINQGWRILRPRMWSDQASYDRFANPIGFVLTFLSVVLTMVFFRADSVRTAMQILKGMVGANGVSLPYTIGARLGAAGEWLRVLASRSSGSAATISSLYGFGSLSALRLSRCFRIHSNSPRKCSRRSTSSRSCLRARQQPDGDGHRFRSDLSSHSIGGGQHCSRCCSSAAPLAWVE